MFIPGRRGNAFPLSAVLSFVVALLLAAGLLVLLGTLSPPPVEEASPHSFAQTANYGHWMNEYLTLIGTLSAK